MYNPNDHKGALEHRVDFVGYVEVRDSVANNGIDTEGPRVDAETGLGYIAENFLKREFRNYIEATREGQPGYAINVIRGMPQLHPPKVALQLLDFDLEDKKAAKNDPYLAYKVRDFMCKNFIDIRTFGGVMPNPKNDLNCGQISGPVSISGAWSVEPITTQTLTISRSTVASEEEVAKAKQTMLGRKYIIPYALYRFTGSISGCYAKKYTGFSEADMEVFFEALMNMFILGCSSSKTQVYTRKIFVFKHDSIYGNAKAHELINAVEVKRVNENAPARCFEDYAITVNYDAIPEGVTLEVMD